MQIVKRSIALMFVGIVSVAVSSATLTAQTLSAPAARQAVEPCAVPANKIIAENCKPGRPREEWDVFASGDPFIQGFATDMSVNIGETVQFKIRTHSPKYRIDVYRMGWYGGAGARLVSTIRPSVPLPQAQPECLVHNATRLVDCGNWKVSASWPVPADAVSGVYVARLVREDDEPQSWRSEGDTNPPSVKPAPTPGFYGALGYGQLRDAMKEKRASHIIFVVRDDNSRSQLLFQTADSTWVAYNRYGGWNLLGAFPQALPGAGGQAPTANIRQRAYRVSYNRPLINRDGYFDEQFFNAEYPLVRWLERNGYDVSYFSSVDSDRRGDKIRDHKVFISAGHDSYWSGSQRKSVEAARDAGVNLAFLSGGVSMWRTRFEPSFDLPSTPNRTLVCYKETIADGKIDSVKEDWTGAWRDPRPFNPIGSKPENALTGTLHTVGGFRNDPLVVSSKFSKLPFWRNTEVAALADGQSVTLGRGVLGTQWDEDVDNGARPGGLTRLSETTVDNVAYIQDLGNTYDSGAATHSLTLYRAPSGAMVFSAGTAQFAWGLDDLHTYYVGPSRVRPDPFGAVKAIQQATVNLLADMGVKANAIQSNLIAAVPSPDVADALAAASPASPSQENAVSAHGATR